MEIDHSAFNSVYLLICSGKLCGKMLGENQRESLHSPSKPAEGAQKPGGVESYYRDFKRDF